MPEFWSFGIPDPVSEDLSGLVVARPDHPGLHIFNHSARFLWCALRNGTPVDRLAEQFAEHFGIPLHQAAFDVSSTLSAWSKTLLSSAVPALVSFPSSSEASPPVPPLPPPSAFLFTADYALGVTSFRLFASDPDFIDEIRPRLAHLAVPTNSAPPPPPQERHIFYVFRTPGDLLLHVFCGPTLLGSEPDSAVARTILLQEIARLAHHPDTQWLTILHAAACASPTTGQAVILPAATNSGKSTLTAALLHSGLQILSDDSAAIDHASRQIVSLPFALMLRQGSWPILTPYFPELASTPTFHRNGDHVRFLPPPVTNGPLLPAVPKCLLFVTYDPAAAETTNLQPLNTLQSLCALQKSGFWVPHTRPAIAAFLTWVQALPAYQLTYSRLADAVPRIHELLQANS